MTANKLKCSVVIPVYNKKNYLSKTLESIFAQDFEDDFEIVIVDDGSTDSGCDGIESLDRRIRLIKQENKGAAVARHVGVKEARGQIVVFQDADDIASEVKLSALVNGLSSCKKCVCAFALTKTDKEKEALNEKTLSYTDYADKFIFDDPLSFMFKRLGPLALSMNIAVWREDAFWATENRQFYHAANDYDMQLRLALRGPFLFINKFTNEYIRNEFGITSTLGRSRQVAYAVISSVDAYRSSKNRSSFKQALKEGINKSIPECLVGLFLYKEYKLIMKVLYLSFPFINIYRLLKGIWWQVDSHTSKAGNKSFILKIIKYALSKRKKVDLS